MTVSTLNNIKLEVGEAQPSLVFPKEDQLEPVCVDQWGEFNFDTPWAEILALKGLRPWVGGAGGWVGWGGGLIG